MKTLVRKRSRQGEVASPLILLVEPDPYMAFLLALDLPQARVVEAGFDSAEEVVGEGADLIILNLASPLASDLLALAPKTPVLGVVDRPGASRVAIQHSPEQVLMRPFAPAELYRAVRRSLGIPQPVAVSSASRLKRVQSWLAPARVGAVALAAVLELANPKVSPLSAVVLAGAFAYSALRLLHRRTGRTLAWVDAALAAAVLAGSGGANSDYMIFALVASLEAGLVLGMRPGALAGSLITAGATPSFVVAVNAGRAGPSDLIPPILLFPLAALSGGLAVRIWRAEGRGGITGLLSEANRVLSSLFRIARTIPGGLEVGSVAASVMEELRENLAAPAGALLVREAGFLGAAGSFGLEADPKPMLATDAPMLGDALVEHGSRVLKQSDLPLGLVGALGDHDCWLAAPLVHQGVNQGSILSACRNHSSHDESLRVLAQIAEETSLAIENARLFAGVRELSADEERARLARELHDGVAQALTHVRLELDFLAAHPESDGQTVRGEASRLARVVERAVGDVRNTIRGLRSTLGEEGLAGSLKSLLRDLQGLGGPDITFRASGDAHLAPAVEMEVFRVAQEAVSNALRHSGAASISVALETTDHALMLSVEDDGRGVTTRVSTDGGVGLKAMEERARQLGGSLAIEPRPGGGTRVTLRIEGDAFAPVPLHEASQA